MTDFGIDFQISIFWAIPLLIVSLWLILRLYHRPIKNQIPKFWFYVLILFRIWVFLLLIFLFLKPLIEQVFRTIEKPYVPVFIDNSASMQMYFPDNNPQPSVSEFTNMLKNEKEIEFDIFSFGKDILKNETIGFKQKFTNISAVFPYLGYLTGKNMVAAVIISDGNHNFGSNPVYLSEKSLVPIINLVVGGDLKSPDIGFDRIFYNQTAFWQTTATLKVQLAADFLEGKKTTLEVKKDGRVLQSFPIVINNSSFFWEKEIELEFKEVGLQLFDFELKVLEGEANVLNNKQKIAIKVIDKKTNWLILGSAPHPDMAAIHGILSDNLNFTVVSQIISNYKMTSVPDAVVLHQLPDISADWRSLSAQFNFGDIPKLVIIGTRTQFKLLNEQKWGVDAKLISRNLDFSNATPESSQSLLQISPAFLDIIQNKAPLITQYAEYKYPLGGNILLKRLYKGIETNDVLMQFVPSTKTVFLNATGIWKWAMEDYKQNASKTNFQEFVNQVASLMLKQNENKENLEYNLITSEGEPAIFQFFVPDSLKLKTAPKLSINKEVINFVPVAENIFQAKVVPDSAGLKNFIFEAVYQNEKKYREEGAFFVEQNLLESKKSRADVALLQQMSFRSKGALLPWESRNQLIDSILFKKNLKSIIRTTSQVDDVIHFKYLFFIILFLLSAEWLVRKYYGLD
jgi:hypothetical protein